MRSLRQRWNGIGYHVILARAALALSLAFQPACFLGGNNDGVTGTGAPGSGGSGSGSGGSGSGGSQSGQNVQAGATNAFQDVLYTYTPTAVSGATWTATGLPSWATLNSSTGEISGYPDAAGSASVTLTATPSSGSPSTVQVPINVAGDPLTTFAWHLNNTGLSFILHWCRRIRTGYGRACGDWRQATGKGVRVAASDTGVEIAHEDLKDNVTAGMSRDYASTPTNNQYSGDPTPTAANAAVDDNAHGTAVAGVAAAEGWNNIGGRGIAPKANVAGFNFLPQPGRHWSDPRPESRRTRLRLTGLR